MPLLEALSLQWEVGNDLCWTGFNCAPCIREPLAFNPAIISSQRPHSSSTVQKCVKFEDQIDVFLGEEDALDMSVIAVTHQALRNWDSKPWDGRRFQGCPGTAFWNSDRVEPGE